MGVEMGKMTVDKQDSSMVIRKAADLKEFSGALRGCVKHSKIKPIDMKQIWARA